MREGREPLLRLRGGGRPRELGDDAGVEGPRVVLLLSLSRHSASRSIAVQHGIPGGVGAMSRSKACAALVVVLQAHLPSPLK